MIPPRALYLMRHGESEANAAHIFAGWSIDPALTLEGRRQAGLQAGALREAGIQAIVASPMRRARETAAIVGRELGLEPRIFADLREAGLGELDGKSHDIPALRAVFEGVLARWQRREHDAGFPGGETLRDLRERFAGFLAGLPADHGPLLVVGHQVLFMTAVWLFCEDPGPSLLAWRLGHCDVTVIARHGTAGFHPLPLQPCPRTLTSSARRAPSR